MKIAYRQILRYWGKSVLQLKGLSSSRAFNGCVYKGCNNLAAICGRSKPVYEQLSKSFSTQVREDVPDNSVGNTEWLEVTSPAWNKPLKLSLRWLRDHCQCPACRDPVTGLRQLGLDLGNSLELNPEMSETRFSDEKITLVWSDGHVSTFDHKWLQQNCYESRPIDNTPMRKTLWNNKKAQSIPFAHLNYEDLMKNEEAVKDFLASILNYGISLVHNVPVTPEHTRLVMERFGPIWRTFWGEIYYVVADLTKHSHPSYTAGHLGFHTDTNYYFEGAGLQAFHVLEHTGTGGKNNFVDGFFVAQSIKDKHSEVYEYLSTTPVSFKYVEKGKLHLVNEDVLFKHHPVTKELIQLRFTPYDFDVFRTVKQEDVEQYYHSLQILINEVNNEDNIHWIQLKPGTVLVTDNWRVLHGRSTFTGKRTLCGMYVSRSDFLSRSRRLGLI